MSLRPRLPHRITQTPRPVPIVPLGYLCVDPRRTRQPSKIFGCSSRLLHPSTSSSYSLVTSLRGLPTPRGPSLAGRPFIPRRIGSRTLIELHRDAYIVSNPMLFPNWREWASFL
ncbi:hypothetical protein NMY22_g18699 [Coprinellus aureogranulatus]|nr:hypothetical protein NMY22_g18699 [Coprinellus aureogranulatus]